MKKIQRIKLNKKYNNNTERCLILNINYMNYRIISVILLLLFSFNISQNSNNTIQ